MALKGASTTVDTDWIDWDGLAKEGAAVVCTVKSIEPEEDFGNGSVAPVRARVIVLTGSKAGEVYPDERILKAGIRLKLQEIGDDVVGRLGVYGKRNHIGLNAEADGDIELAERALAKFGRNDEGGAGRTKAKVTTKKAVADDDEDDSEEPPF
ncbi:MAG TPA: hypothetical protein VH084_08730 [Mycobacterium sp.]|nr:hypothetical protein [Mycobacterium sp.]